MIATLEPTIITIDKEAMRTACIGQDPGEPIPGLRMYVLHVEHMECMSHYELTVQADCERTARRLAEELMYPGEYIWNVEVR